MLHAWAPFYRRSSWHSALKHHGVDDEALADKLAIVYIDSRRNRHVVYDDVAPSLDALKRRYKLALLTNGEPGLQQRKVLGSGISSYFSAIIISGEEGVGKPDSQIFRTALSRLGTSSEATIMIGNSLVTDIKGAQAAGMKAVWLNRSGKLADKSIQPDLVVRNLFQLKEALNSGQLA